MRPSGKTTKIWENAIQLLGEIPEDQYVFITGLYTDWLHALDIDFKNSGLVGIKVLTINQILKSGALNGYKGKLLIDDFWDISIRDRTELLSIKRRLEIGS